MNIVSRLSRSAAVLVALALMLTASSQTRADGTTPAAAGGISGTVTDTAGGQAKHVTVKLFNAPAGGAHGKKKGAAPAAALGNAGGQKAVELKGGGKGRPALQETTTGDDGAFSFTNVAAGDYLVVVAEKGVGSAHGRVTVTGTDTARVSLTLKAHKGGKGAKAAK